MRGLVIFLLALVATGIVSFSFVVANINNANNKEIENNKNPKILEFSTFTSAVCENKEKFVYCKDEYFVDCNGIVSKAIDVIECNGMKVDVPKALGFAVFEKGWKDPRN